MVSNNNYAQDITGLQTQLTQALTQIAALQAAQAASATAPAALRPANEPKINVDLLFKEHCIALNPDGKDPLVLNVQDKVESIMTKVNLQTGNRVSLERFITVLLLALDPESARKVKHSFTTYNPASLTNGDENLNKDLGLVGNTKTLITR